LPNTLGDSNAHSLFKTTNRINPVVVNETLSGTKIKVAHIGFLREAFAGNGRRTRSGGPASCNDCAKSVDIFSRMRKF